MHSDAAGETNGFGTSVGDDLRVCALVEWPRPRNLLEAGVSRVEEPIGQLASTRYTCLPAASRLRSVRDPAIPAWWPIDWSQAVVEVLDKPITRADVYDLEQGLQDQVFDLLMPSALDGSLSLDELLSDHFVRDLHARMFGPVWDWAGR